MLNSNRTAFQQHAVPAVCFPLADCSSAHFAAERIERLLPARVTAEAFMLPGVTLCDLISATPQQFVHCYCPAMLSHATPHAAATT
jgi:hypothetical protein